MIKNAYMPTDNTDIGRFTEKNLQIIDISPFFSLILPRPQETPTNLNRQQKQPKVDAPVEGRLPIAEINPGQALLRSEKDSITPYSLRALNSPSGCSSAYMAIE